MIKYGKRSEKEEETGNSMRKGGTQEGKRQRDVRLRGRGGIYERVGRVIKSKREAFQRLYSCLLFFPGGGSWIRGIRRPPDDR